MLDIKKVTKKVVEGVSELKSYKESRVVNVEPFIIKAPEGKLDRSGYKFSLQCLPGQGSIGDVKRFTMRFSEGYSSPWCDFKGDWRSVVGLPPIVRQLEELVSSKNIERCEILVRWYPVSEKVNLIAEILFVLYTDKGGLE